MRSLSTYIVILSLALGLTVMTAEPVSAQFYFGKNKVQYTRFEWQVMQTDHFRIYFYTEEAEIARVAAGIAEDSYRVLAARFNLGIEDKTPLIIYSSPNYFSQTNVIPSILPEAVAGFTEFMKGRVVLPYHGSYHDFHHVLQHELVHVFQLAKQKELLSRRGRVQFARPPLWFTEGLAEKWSKEWDTEADMIVKDMVVNNRLFTIDNLWRVRGSYFMYKLGESICTFIDSTYGPDKLVRLYENLTTGSNFNEVVRNTLGDDLKEVSRKWEYSLKKRFYPEIDTLGLPDMDSKRITGDGYSVKGVPIRWDAGDGEGVRDWLVYKANRVGYSGIYMTPIGDRHGKEVKTLIKGDRSAEFESLYLLRSGIDADDSGRIVFSSKSKESDVIYIYDLRQGGITHRFEFKELAAARSPRFSSDGRRIVFSGVRLSGYTDIYVLDITDGTYAPIMEDMYYDLDPTFTPDGSAIVFVSDRAEEGKTGATNLFRYDIASGNLTQLTFGSYKDQSPEATDRGIFFSSNRTGSFNLYLLASDGTLTQQSTYVTGAFDPRLTSDGKRLTYTGYQNLGFQIYQMDLPPSPEPVPQPLASESGKWEPMQIDSRYAKSSVRYKTDYSLDIAQSSIGYDPVYGSIGGIQMAISDMLGNRAYYLLLTNTADTKDEFIKSFNVGVTYINRERRLNWGVGAFHLYDDYFNDYDGYYTERQAGLISLFSYPFSKFHRVDLTTVARYSDKDYGFSTRNRKAFLVTNYLSLVFDNSLWDISGPIEGRRYNFTVGLTSRADEPRVFNRLAMVDVRHYLRLGRYSAFANRLFAYASSGTEPQRIYFGGSWSFRGFDRREWYVRHVLFTSNELRFPLLDHLYIGLPFGGVDFASIRGALFFDAGTAWDN